MLRQIFWPTKPLAPREILSGMASKDASTSFAGLLAGARFFGRLPLYLRRRVTLPEARALLAERLRLRTERFADRLSGKE